MSTSTELDSGKENLNFIYVSVGVAALVICIGVLIGIILIRKRNRKGKEEGAYNQGKN